MDPELIRKANQAIEAVASGMSLKDVLDIIGLSATNFNKVISSVRECAMAYASAREISSELDVDSAVSIADDPTIDPQRARNMIDIRKWRASKYHSRLFGDRIEMQFSGSVSISDALTEARSRVPALFEDVEIVETPTLQHERITGVIEDKTPDIFS